MDGMTAVSCEERESMQPRSRSILLSAYACEPNKGSEPGIGWQWAMNLAALGHRVWVITRANNREAIEQAMERTPVKNVAFLYYDLPAWARSWKRGGRGVHLYYLLWQLGAYRVARDLTRRVAIDVVHHITFGVYRHPSFMAFLGLPFVFGPVGGGERAPWGLRKGFPLRGHVADMLRDGANWAAGFDPLMRAMYRRTAVTLCKTRETLERVPIKYRANCRVQLELGMEGDGAVVEPGGVVRANDTFDVLFVGRLLYLKGLHLALQAFARSFRGDPTARFTIIGSGKDQTWIQTVARRLDLESQIRWIPWIPREELLQKYREHDVLLFPSLHDSSGNVVLEAMAAGLPVVCVNLGGPGQLVDEDGGIAVPAGSRDEVVAGLAQALTKLARDPALRMRLARQARISAWERFSWPAQARRMTDVYEQIIGPASRVECLHE